jgi:hypothetical protein
MSISAINPEDYQNALRKLQQTLPISSKHLLGLVGKKPSGSLVLVPGSFERGYFDSFISPLQRPHYALNLGVVGQLSNGAWVFPPSYDAGLKEGTNNLKAAILAEGIARLMRERERIELAYRQIAAQLEELRARDNAITSELENLRRQTQD